jgi:hypothetical protein
MFLDLQDPDPELFVRLRIQIVISSSKKVRKTSISTVLRLLYDFLSFKNDVNVPSKVRNKQKNMVGIGTCLQESDCPDS